MTPDKWLLRVLPLSLLFISLIVFFFSLSPSPSPSPTFFHRSTTNPPSFAYFISGGAGDLRRLLRLLLAVYHPRNRYLLHLSADAPDSDRKALAADVRFVIPAAEEFGNVDVVGKADVVTYMGASGLAATLHAASVMMKLDGGWDWFVTLSAEDYPLVTQDDLIYVFSSVPRNLNFIDHTSDLGWKEYYRVQPIAVDPGLYLSQKSKILEASKRRATPDAFRFFTGSPWVILSRPFIEFCILGWDNLPRTLLLYFTNVVLPQEGYFQSVICNSPEFRNSTVNSDLRYMVWDSPPRMEPHFLNTSDYKKMVSEVGVPFARKFLEDDPVLDRIDAEILRRGRHRAVPGAWCSAKTRMWADPCSQWQDADLVRPGPRAEKFGEVMKVLHQGWKSRSSSCK